MKLTFGQSDRSKTKGEGKRFKRRVVPVSNYKQIDKVSIGRFLTELNVELIKGLNEVELLTSKRMEITRMFSRKVKDIGDKFKKEKI